MSMQSLQPSFSPITPGKYSEKFIQSSHNIRVRTCIIDEAVKLRLEPDLRLADQVGDALLLGDVADNEGDPVLAKLGRQLGQSVSSETLIDVRDTNFGTWTL